MIDIGGQAVVEGVMMKSKTHYAVAIRKSDNTIDVKVNKCKSFIHKHKIFGLPILRGIVVFIESIILGSKTLSYSADFFEEEESKFEQFLTQKFGEKAIVTTTMILSFLFSLIIFMLLPMWISQIFKNIVPSMFILNIIEGALRIFIFLGYMKLVSNIEDIGRTFEYHGAEHKTINCLEAGKELTIENVKQCSRLHKSCGTSFLFIVMVVSILIFSVFTTNNLFHKTILRIALMPVISGISYEFIRWARIKNNSQIANFLSKPGMWLQKTFTTLEPDDAQIEVAIMATKGVLKYEFD
ncbi:MAG: hypothetical protein ATN36_06775 [Epulopiscium sp. Nele67-Bin005]|nr:MAG: hypothetical protein ATN36_06775 [Epulopiscium sp. Nele67-Bin005]